MMVASGEESTELKGDAAPAKHSIQASREVFTKLEHPTTTFAFLSASQ